MNSNTCMYIKHKHENCRIHTKIRNETTNRVCRTFFFVIFYRFNKQNRLVITIKCEHKEGKINKLK